MTTVSVSLTYIDDTNGILYLYFFLSELEIKEMPLYNRQAKSPLKILGWFQHPQDFTS